jgi:hypothetical protein
MSRCFLKKKTSDKKIAAKMGEDDSKALGKPFYQNLDKLEDSHELRNRVLFMGKR